MNRWIALLCLLVWLSACVGPTSQNELQDFLDDTRNATAPAWDELWILDRDPAPSPLDQHGLVPADGDASPEITATEVDAHVIGRLASVRVRQNYRNPKTTTASVEYRLPLPIGAAVTDFAIRYGDRHIRAVVRERAQAERLYLAARNQGLLARIVTRTASGFRQALGGLPAASSIEVETSYLQPISHRDEWCYFDLPIAGHGDAEVSVEIDAGVPIADVQVGPGFSVEQPASHRLVLTQPKTASRPSRDVRWRVLTQGYAGALFLAEHSLHGSFFLLTLYGSTPAVDWRGSEPGDMVPRTRPGGDTQVILGRVIGNSDEAPEFVTGNQPLRVHDVSTHARAMARAWAILQVDELAKRARVAESHDQLGAIAAEMRGIAMRFGVPSYVTAGLLIDTEPR